jgi:hypothetical protein
MVQFVHYDRMRRPDRQPSPPPWRRCTSTTDRIEFERRSDVERVRLVARRTGRSRPPGSGTQGWTIDLERRSRELSSTRSVGHAVTRSRAVRSLIGAMRTVNDALDGGENGGGSENPDGEERGGGHETLVERLRGQNRRSARGGGHRPGTGGRG